MGCMALSPQWDAALLKDQNYENQVYVYVNKLTAWSVTLSKRISYESLVAATLRNMVPHPAVCIHTTEARTGVLAFSVDARSVCGAVCIDQTLRSAIGWASNHLRQAGALTAISNLPRRIAVWTTWVGVTWIICHHRFNC